MRASREDRPTSRGALLLAAVVSIAIGSFVPYGDVVLYPFTLLATWVHEMGHGLAALATGGAFDRLEIFRDASGLAWTRSAHGVASGLVSLGGLVAPPLVGAGVLATARGPRRAQIVLVAFVLAMLVSLPIWVRSLAGFVAVPGVALLLAGVVWFGSGRERMVVAQFLGLRLAADTLGRGLDYLFTDSVRIDGAVRTSDIAAVAEGLGGPRIVWSVLVAGVSLAAIALGLLAAWRRQRGVTPAA